MSTNELAIKILESVVANKDLILIVTKNYDTILFLKNKLTYIFERDKIQIEQLTKYSLQINNTRILFNTLDNQKKPSGIRPDLVLHF